MKKKQQNAERMNRREADSKNIKKNKSNQSSTDSKSKKKKKNELSFYERYKEFFMGKLPLGCQYCIEGAKAVIFFGGECTHPDHCRWYCPISQERRNPNAYFVDELCYDSENVLFEEIEAIDAKGVSFTGGEPLISLEKTQKIANLIRMLKEKKGKPFHIHLYTTGIGFTEEKADLLFKAGLDEIRFHPPPNDFEGLKIALKYQWDVGCEIPAIPDAKYLEWVKILASFLRDNGGKFLNLNEFEMVETNYKELEKRGFRIQQNRLANVEKSREMYMPLLKELAGPSFSVHFCTVENKDSNQLRKRYTRRAQRIKRAYEMVTEDGLLYFLRINGSPQNIKEFVDELKNESGVPDEMIGMDGYPNYIDLPYFLAENQDFLDMVKEYGLDGSLIEGLPFRGAYFQVCEQIPLFYFDEDENFEDES